MFVDLFNVKVEDVNPSDLSVTLRLKDEKGNTLTLFFNSLLEVRDFSRDIRRAVLDESDRICQQERPALITDRRIK